LEAQLVARGRLAEAASVMAHQNQNDVSVKLEYLLLAGAGAGFEKEASALADSAASSFDRRAVVTLWHLAGWEARRKNVDRLRSIAAAIARKADSSDLRRDKLLKYAVAARLKLVEGDSASGIQMLRALFPSAPRGEIAWQPWESLGPERMTLAAALLARGNAEEAHRVASQLDGIEPVTYPLYLRSSLQLRLRAATAMKNRALAEAYSRRIEQLSR
jgi:hypothetical protein